MKFKLSNSKAWSASGVRLLVVAALSILLHVLSFQWMAGALQLPDLAQDKAPPETLHAVLIQTQAVPVAPVVTVTRTKPRPPKSPKPVPPKNNPPIAATAAQPSPTSTSSAISTETSALTDSSTSADTLMTAGTSAPTQASSEFDDSGFGDPSIALLVSKEAAKSTSTIENQGYTFAPPPSATLQYDVKARRDGQMVYGRGSIAWAFNGERYTIHGKAGILFFTVLDFSSQGRTHALGIAPDQYTEKRFRRAPTTTHFNRENRQISFSASTKTLALQAGAQDRASIIWQLASMGRGDAARFNTKPQISLFIAGTRDGSLWNIQVLGEEEIEVGLGKLKAWHVRRAPRAGDKDQTLDIWLAPSHEWYPVKLRYTEVNGEYLDLSLADIKPTQ